MPLENGQRIAATGIVRLRLGEPDAPVGAPLEIAKDIPAGLKVSLTRISKVTREKADASGNVQARVAAEPVEAANQGLIVLDESRFPFRRAIIMGDAVDGEATAKRE